MTKDGCLAPIKWPKAALRLSTVQFDPRRLRVTDFLNAQHRTTKALELVPSALFSLSRQALSPHRVGTPATGPH